MQYSTVIFDFDGTIADTEQIAFDTINALAPDFGFEPLRAEEMPRLKRMRMRELLGQRLRIPRWNVWAMYRLEKKSREIFAAKAGAIKIFSGMATVVQQLRAAGYQVGIVSSSSPAIIAKALQEFGISMDFVHAGSRFSRKANALKEALRTHGIERSRAVYVGDELRDVEACKEAGVYMIGVSWGFNDATALKTAGVDVAETPEELHKKIVA